MTPAYIPLTVTPTILRAELESRGLERQVIAAAVLGVTQGAVSRWLSGHVPIPRIVSVALRAIPKRTAQDKRKTKDGSTRKTNTLKG